jgi:hypothetical protein
MHGDGTISVRTGKNHEEEPFDAVLGTVKEKLSLKIMVI